MGCDTDHAWAAGFIDGEGSFLLKPIHGQPDRWRTQVEVAQIHLAPLEKLRDLYGGYICILPLRPNRRQAWSWRISGAKAMLPLLTAITPYLIVKRRQAELLTQYAQTVEAKPGRPKGLTETQISSRQTIYAAFATLRQGG